MLDRIATLSNLRKRRVLYPEEDISCQLCKEQEEETVAHLFLKCKFADSVWSMIKEWLELNFQDAENLKDGLINFANSKVVSMQKEWIMIWHGTLWFLWKARNDLLFNGKISSMVETFETIKWNNWFWLSSKFSFRGSFNSGDWENFPKETLKNEASR